MVNGRRAEKDDVISVSSDGSSVEQSDSCSPLLGHTDPQVRSTSGDVTVRPFCIDLVDSRWSFPEFKPHNRIKSACEEIIDLTESDTEAADQNIENRLPLGRNTESVTGDISNECGFDSSQQHVEFKKKRSEPKDCEESSHFQERLLSNSASAELSVFSEALSEERDIMALCSRDARESSKTLKTVLRTTNELNVPEMESSLKIGDPVAAVTAQIRQVQEGRRPNREAKQLESDAESSSPERRNVVARINDNGAFLTSQMLPSPSCSPFSLDEQEFRCSDEEQSDTYEDAAEDGSHSPDGQNLESSGGNSRSPAVFHSVETESGSGQSELTSAQNSPDWQSDPENYYEDLENDIPMFNLLQDGSEEDDCLDFRAVGEEDRHFVCPVSLEKLMTRPTLTLFPEDGEDFPHPKRRCSPNLSLVYSTIDENYPAGTLELLRDIIQPGYDPPKDITSHLLRGILLDSQPRRHLCVQAFTLLMRTQMHHMADKTTIPWDWELLTSVMDKQEEQAARHQGEVVCMLLEYIVQTLEDDFQAKRCSSDLHQSIAKATLSCDQQFPRVRDVMKWLFSAILKSTDNNRTSVEKHEHVRMVSMFQKMLSLAVEVDRCPALNSAKLSQELFLRLIGDVTLRAHRMLLLETLESKLVRCKLLEHLLVYACTVKSSLPMSLSLLLYFLKNCTLLPDPSDQAERWQKWEELVHLLWMLLLSYNKAMKTHLCHSSQDQRSPFVYKSHDKVTKEAVKEAVDAFLLRSQLDLGRALPLHVDESLTYLQDLLLDVCRS